MYHLSSVILMLIAVRLTVIPVHGQLSVLWNGSAVTRPSLIFLDELLVDDYSTANIGNINLPGALVCMSNRARVSWHFVNGSIVSDAPRTDSRAIVQIRTGAEVTPSISRLSVSMEGFASDAGHVNGIWHCRLNAVRNINGDYDYEDEINVGIYSRGQARGSISRVDLELDGPSVPFTFAIRGYSYGGPPTAYFWTRNNEIISHGGVYNISIGLNMTDSEAYQQAIYASVLTVTEGLPGVYQYSASNRISLTLERSITIQRGPQPLNLRAVQNGFMTVGVSWDAPSPPPTFGYRVRVTTELVNITINMQSSPVSIAVPQIGDYRISVESMAHPILSEPAEVGVTVLGISAPVVGIITHTTSIRLFWTTPKNTLPPTDYIILLTRATGRGQTLCLDFEDKRTAELNASTIMQNLVEYELTGLQEFSFYSVTIINNYNLFDQFRNLSMDHGGFVTTSAAPTGSPENVTASFTSQSVSISWEPIECIERNGRINAYNVEFISLSGAVVPGKVTGQTFTASGLTPHTEYFFRVAGINNNGQGPFSKTLTFITGEDIPGAVTNLITDTLFTSVLIAWAPPRMPNGVIIAYEVFYRISNGYLTAVNTTDISTAFSLFLDLNTTLSSISVRAYTSAGPGPAVVQPDVFIPEQPAPPAVSEVEVEMLDDTSVMVSWESFLIPEIVNYTVYYSPRDEAMVNQSEQAVTVPSFESSVVIENLMTGVEYQFQVAAIAELEGRLFPGERSDAALPRTITSPEPADPTMPQTTPPVNMTSSPEVVVAGLDEFLLATVTGGVAGSVVVLIVITIIAFLCLILRDFKHFNIWEKRFSNPILSRFLKEQSRAADIVVFPSNMYAIKGDNVFFKVLALGAPPLFLTWFHDGAQLNPNRTFSMKESGSLYIRHAKLKHSGVYRLVAVNNFGSAVREVKLTVTGEQSVSIQESELTSSGLESDSYTYESDLSASTSTWTLSSSELRSAPSTWDSEPLYARASGLISPSARTVQLTACPIDVESTVPVAMFRECVARGHEALFGHQFNRLETGEPATTSESSSVYDQNRIVLKPLEGFAECQEETINASYIHGRCKPNKFIAVQGPNEHMTVIDFWRLIWQEKPSVIVMMTKVREGCEQYWPESGSITFGPFIVTLTEVKVFSDYCVRTMEIVAEGLALQSDSTKALKVTQYQYTAWPEQGVPDDPTSMFSFYRKVISEHMSSESPILVQHSAEMGVFICLDSVLEQLGKNQLVDIAGTVSKVKNQYTRMIQTLEQCVFVHDAVLEVVADKERESKSKSMLQENDADTT